MQLIHISTAEDGFTMIAELFVFFVTIFLAIYFYFVHSFGYWKRKGVPFVQESFPFGALKGINRTNNIGGILKDLYFKTKDDPVLGFNFFHEPILLIRSPEVIREVLIKDFSTFHDRGFLFNTERDPLTNHLFLLNGIKWRNLRIKLTPTFTSGKMKMMFKTMLVSSEEMVRFLETPASAGEIMEVKDLFAKFTMNVISRCAFGLELDSYKNPNNQFKELTTFLLKPSFFRSFFNTLFFNLPKLMYNIPIRFIPKEVSDFFIGTVTDTMTYRTENNVHRNDFMQLLMELREKGRLEDDESDAVAEQIVDEQLTASKFTFHELAAQAFIFFVAGYETASSSLQFGLYELARNTHIQYTLRKEIDSVLEKYNGEITYEAVQEMTYLDQVVSETLRLYPAAQFLTRITSGQYKLPNSDVELEKGQRIFISLLGVQMDPKYFPDPEKFDPDRFSPVNKSKILPYTYMPFGDGPRQCIGMRFGLMQVKLGLVQFLKHFRAELCDASPPYPIKLDPKAILTSLRGGMYLKVSNR